jgi:hypothetical protein
MLISTLGAGEPGAAPNKCAFPIVAAAGGRVPANALGFADLGRALITRPGPLRRTVHRYGDLCDAGVSLIAAKVSVSQRKGDAID